MSIVEFLSQPFWQRLGLTLVHFLWQGLAVAVLVGVSVRVLRLKHGNVRYGAYLVALIAMIACPVVTFTAIDIDISANTELVTVAEPAEVVDSSPYTPLSEGDILPEAEIPRPAIPTLADSIPLSQRISEWLNVSMPWVLVIWMVGVMVLSMRLLMGFIGVYRWRHHLEALPEKLAQRIVSLSEGLGMRGFSRVFISPTVLQAMAVGYLRPMVLLPAAMLTQMQPEMLEAVIAHELAHIRRFDLWVNLIQRVTETLLFYHPAVWWLSICLRSERELCCDELAVKATGQRLTYASTLESVGRARFMAKPPVLAAGLGQDNKPTLGRVRHILGLKPAQRNCPFWLAGVITVLFLAALVIPTTLALTNRSDGKLKHFERVVVEGIGANRDKFKCGYLAWSSKQITTRFADSNRPAQELAGEYELWWDGSKKIATKYVRDEVHKDPEGNFRIEKGQGGTSYDGGVLSWKPDFHSDNWLGPEVTRWRGLGSQDWLIRQKSKLDHVTKDWSVIDANGANLIRCMSKNTNETARDYGAYSIRDYDPSKGYGLVNEEWYNPNGSPRLKHTVKILEVIPGGWFPVEVDFKSFAITDGRVYSRNHYALDIERCSFNDKSAFPAGIFKGAVDKQLKYQEKVQNYLAMELKGLSVVKEIDKADKIKRDAYEAIEKFVAAARVGDFETGRQFADPDKAPYDQIEELHEVAKNQNLWIMAVVADDFDAIAVSSVIFGDHERIGPLVFFLDRKPQDGRDNWWLYDIDMETPDSAEVELKKFLEKHPKAQKVPYENKSAVQVSAQELVAKIIESERRIEDIQLHMTCTIPAKNLVFYEYDWGYDSGKEFYAGFRNSTKPGRNEISRTTQITRAFDGQNEWSLRVSSEDKQPSGAIFKPSFSNFRSMMTFNTLLGFDAKEHSRLSFGEAVAQAESISVSDNVEFIEGRPCYVIEAVNLETDTSVNWAYDVRAWVDYQRDCRLLKFEKYRSISGKNRFKVVSRRVDNIKLKQVDGIWLPIEGRRTTFSTNDYGPPKGMTLAQFAALPTEEQERVGVFKLTPMSPPRRLEVDVKSIRVNKGIPPERFTIAFPDGCEVYNEFTGNRYVVGQPSEREAALSDAEWIEQMAGLSVSKLIDILRNSSVGKDKKKWFAAIHRLVEIGSTAVPELVAELRQTEKPQTQSKLALTLRTIGDPKAVPGLIDGLGRAGFSSDYGIGEVRTELDMFIQQHQMDPTKKDLGLGRPVREITIALEKLTGHTEGHDHFHAYDLKYDRLGSYTITPEIRDRQRQHRRQVAERWRKWWQANKDNIKPTETLPKPPAEPKPARSERLERMIMAAPEGSILEFHIAPEAGKDGWVGLNAQDIKRYRNDLLRNGPFAGVVRGDDYQWYGIYKGLNLSPGLIVGQYKGQNYLLLCARAQYVMVPELEGKLAWGFQEVYTIQNNRGRPVIGFELDEKGAELFYALTEANRDRALAIVIDGKVISAPAIQAAIRNKGLIIGNFTEGEAEKMAVALRKGMTPVDQQTIKAMRLITEAADKLNKQDVAKMGPRQVVENFLIAGLGGLNEKLRWFVRPGSAVDKILDGTDLSEELLDGHKIKVVNVYADSKDAFAVTSDITDQYGEQIGQFMFYLSNESDNWLIYDLDAGKANKVRESLTEFLSTHPDVQVEGGGSTRTKAQLIKPEIVKTSDGRAKLSHFSRYVHCRELAKWVIEKFGFITDKDITCDEGKNQISILCPTTGDAETVFKFLQEVDVEPIKVRMDLLVVETYPDAELDHETKIAAENVTHTKFNKSLSVPDILRETAKAEPQPENSIEKLIDLLTSRGYLKILMNPTLEVVNGKTAKVQSSQRLPTGKEINDSFEVTPQILDDGSIDVATKMVFENRQIGDPRTHINIKDSESLVIGSVTKTEKRDIVRDGVKGSEERTTEVLVILTLTIITPEMNLSKKPDVQVNLPEKKDQKELSKFKTTLPNGVTVELIGMCEYPSVDKQWWRPDGSLLVKPPYDESDIDILSFRKPNAIPIEFAFRLSGNLDEPAWETKVKGDEQAFVWWTGRRSKDGEFLTDIKSIGMFVKSDQRILNLRLGFSFADGPYEWIDFKNISVKPNFKPAVQVEGEGAWGEAVEGVQMRVRAERQRWYEGETPKFRIDMRNTGIVEWELGLTQENWEVELDGLWHRVGASFTGDFPTLPFGPGQEHKDIEFYPGVWSEWNINGKPLKFTPGLHTVRLSFGPSTRDRAYWRRLRVVSNPVVIEILPKGERDGTVDESDAATSLQAELNELWLQRDQGLAVAEAFGKRLLEKYTEREEKPLIYYQLAEIYAQSGQADPNKIVECARQGWWSLNDPVKKARLFVYWGDALQLTKGREEAARIYLRGLQFCLQYGLPKEKPELPTVSRYTVDGPAEEVEKHDKENKRRMAARKHAKIIGELIEHRQALTGRIVQLYAPLPDAFDELHELVMRYLGSEQASKQIIAAAKSYRIDHKTAIPVIMRIGGDPNPRADLDWGEETKGIRVRLRADTKSWGAGGVPKFKLDVRNEGSHILMLTSAPDCWGVEVDGVWYRVTIPMLGGAKGMSFGPDKRWYNLELSLDKALGSQNENVGFELAPGRHTVRAALASGLSEDGEMLSVRAVSNPVEIVILATGSDVKRKPDVEIEVEKTSQSQHPTTLPNGVTVEQPATIRVPEDYPTAYAAVKAAKSGDTLIISADRYQDEDILIEPNLEIEFEKSALPVEGEGAWGEAVEGVQCRLRADKYRWETEEKSIFKADIRNRGELELYVHAADEFCQLEIDGEWHGWSGPWGLIGVKQSPLGHGSQINDISISLAKTWFGKKSLLALTAGVHTVRVAFILQRSEREYQNIVRAVSNPVEIEIVPAKAKPAVQVEAEGIKTEIQEVVKGFWTAAIAKDWQAVNDNSQIQS